MGYIPYGFIQRPTGIFVEPQQAIVKYRAAPPPDIEQSRPA